MKQYTKKNTLEFENLELRKRNDVNDFNGTEELRLKMKQNIDDHLSNQRTEAEDNKSRIVNQFNIGFDDSHHGAKSSRGNYEIERLNRGLQSLQIGREEFKNFKPRKE